MSSQRTEKKINQPKEKYTLFKNQPTEGTERKNLRGLLL